MSPAPAAPAAAPAAGNLRGRETRQRILDAAERCFAERGIALTLEDVGREAGTTRMTVHRHTGGRERLLRHLVLRASTRLGEEVTAIFATDAPFADRLTDGLTATISVVRANPTLAALLTDATLVERWGPIDPDDEVIDVIYRFTRAFLAEADAGGLLRVPLEDAVWWLLAQIRLVLLAPWVVQDGADALRAWFGGLVVPAILRA